jgi:rhomboid protease GluP
MDIENSKGTHWPIATVSLGVLNIAVMVFVICKFNTIEPDPQTLVSVGGNIRSLTFGGQFWRLIISAFLHVDIQHILFNVISLFSIGIALERLIGSVNIFCVYLLTAVSGGLLSLVFHDNIVCVGASGAVFGLLGATITYLISAYEREGIDPVSVISFMKSGLICLGINFVYSLLPEVDMAGHIGGLVGGLILGFIIGIPVNGAFVGAFVVGVLLLQSWRSGVEPERLTERELSIEVGNFMKENFEKSLKQSGGSDVEVIVEDMILVHDEGDKYHGFVQLEIRYDGKKENLIRGLKVDYDGTQFSYELQNSRED